MFRLIGGIGISYVDDIWYARFSSFPLFLIFVSIQLINGVLGQIAITWTWIVVSLPIWIKSCLDLIHCKLTDRAIQVLCIYIYICIHFWVLNQCVYYSYKTPRSQWQWIHAEWCRKRNDRSLWRVCVCLCTCAKAKLNNLPTIPWCLVTQMVWYYLRRVKSKTPDIRIHTSQRSGAKKGIALNKWMGSFGFGIHCILNCNFSKWFGPFGRHVSSILV